MMSMSLLLAALSASLVCEGASAQRIQRVDADLIDSHTVRTPLFLLRYPYDKFCLRLVPLWAPMC